METEAILRRFSSWRRRLVSPLSGAILEIGVGQGENVRHYRSASSVDAIEPDMGRAQRARNAAVRVSRKRGIPMRIQVAAAEKLPFADARFDSVVSSLVFCSVADPVQALAEIQRVLKPDGILWMVEHVRPRSPYFASLATAVTPLWRRVACNCHLDRPTLDLLAEEGWRCEVVKRRGIFVKLRASPPVLPLV